MHWITGTNILMELQSDYQQLPPLNVEQKYGFNVLMSVLPGISQNKQLTVVSLEFLRLVYEDVSIFEILLPGQANIIFFRFSSLNQRNT
jgi:hypothetical protein